MKNMRVVQKDPIISGMLEDERKRCANAVRALEAKADQYPKGSIHLRNVRQKNRIYSYPFLKYREGGKSVFKHLAAKDLEAVEEGIKNRKSVEQEINKVKKRMHYLDRLLASGKFRGKKDQ